MRILCVGAGAVGGYFGARLIEAGADVTFLVRPARRNQIAADGLRVQSAKGNFNRRVNAVVQTELRGPFDVILLTCKAYDLSDAMNAVAPVAGSVIVPLLNGVAHMDVLNARFGAERVLGGTAKISVTLAADGTIQHLNDWNYITVGEQSGESTPRVDAFADAFKNTPVVAAVVPNIMHVLWEKFVHLATVAGMNAAMRANIGEIVRTEIGAELLMEFLERNAEIARREGFMPSQQIMNECRQMISNPLSRQAASMLRDIERNGPTEADHIIGYMLEKALEHGVDPTMHRIIYAHLQAYEQRRTQGAVRTLGAA